MSLTFTDVFCGAGGSSLGMTAAGFELRLAANHWDRAIETHAANFPDADHLCADVSNYDMRRLPRTDVLWASPECVWHSPAGGRKRKRAQLDLFDEYVPSDAGDRSRMTMVDVIRATEVHRYPVVVVENVVEAASWELFDWWLDGMAKLRPGYRHQILCVSSAHVAGEHNPPAPQWRDRMYVVFTRTDVARPDLTLRPPAWCPTCDEVVDAEQAWRRLDRPRLVGKYGQQYDYRCPRAKCRRAVVEPYVLPAAAAIDWTDLGQRIGDRDRPLKPATMRRIRAGLAMFAQPVTVATGGGTFERTASGYKRAWPALDAPLRTRTATAGDALACPPVVLNVNHQGDDGRPYPAGSAPLAARTARIGDGLATPAFYVKNYGSIDEAQYRAWPVDNPLGAVTTHDSHSLVSLPFLTVLRRNVGPVDVAAEPLRTITTEHHHGLTVPPGAFVVKNHGGLDYGPIGHMCKDVDEPLGTVVARPNMSLVVPYRRARTRTTAEPLHTLATHDSAGLCPVEIDVDDCRFRMLRPREHLRGQRIPDPYIVTGNQGEQTMQAGNAVSVNVAQWLGTRIAPVLGGDS